MCLRIYCNRFFLVTSLLVFLSSISFAQSETDPDSTCAPQKDIPQLIREALKKTTKGSENIIFPFAGSYYRFKSCYWFHVWSRRSVCFSDERKFAIFHDKRKRSGDHKKSITSSNKK